MEIIAQPSALIFVGNLSDIIATSDRPTVNVLLESGADTLLDEDYNPDNNDTIRIDLEDFIDDYLSIQIPSSDLFLQENGAREFTLTLDDGVNEEILTFTVIKGGVSRKNLDTLAFVKENLLTWQPQTQTVKYTDLLWLTAYISEESLVKVKAYFAGGTDETITLHSIEDAGLYSWNVNFSYIRSQFDFQPIYFDCWVESVAQSEGEPSSRTFTQRYVLTVELFDYDDFFVFENSLGGIDSIRFTGEKQLVNANKFDVGLFFDKISEEYQVNPDKAFEKNTGYYHSKKALLWSQDFFSSKQKFIYELNVLNRILTRDPQLVDVKHQLIDFDFAYIYTEQQIYLDLRREEDLANNLEIIGPDDTQYFLVPRLYQFPSLNDPTDALFPVQTEDNPQWQTLSFETILNFILNAVDLPSGDRIIETTITFTAPTVATVYGKWLGNGIQRELTQSINFGALPPADTRRWDFVEFYPNGTMAAKQGVENTDPVKPVLTSGALLAHEILWFDEGTDEVTPTPEAGTFPNTRYRTNTALPGADRYAKIFEQAINANQSYHFILDYAEYSSDDYETTPSRTGMLEVSFKGGSSNGSLSDSVQIFTHAGNSAPGDFVLMQIAGGKAALYHKRNSMFGQLQFRVTFYYSTVIKASFLDLAIHFSLPAGDPFESVPFGGIADVDGGNAEESPVTIKTRSDIFDNYDTEQPILKRGEFAIEYDPTSGLPIGLKAGAFTGDVPWNDLPWFYYPSALAAGIEDWSEVVEYENGDWVAHEGNIWRATDTSLDVTPGSDDLKWMLSSVGEFFADGPIPLHRLARTAAIDGQALVWSAANNRWEPGEGSNNQENKNIDGGAPDSIYLPIQKFDGGIING